MVSREVRITIRSGLHARPAALLVQRANDFGAQIHIRKGKNRINAKSIIGVLALGATYNTTLEISADGDDEVQALDALVALIEGGFEGS